MKNIEVNLKVECKNGDDALGIKEGAVYTCSSNDMTRFTVAVPEDLGEHTRLIDFSIEELSKHFEVATKLYIPSFMLDDRALEEAYRAKHLPLHIENALLCMPLPTPCHLT